jgi:two-component system sensor histidine kinase KdpD
MSAVLLDNDDPVPSAMRLFRDALPVRGVSALAGGEGAYETVARWGDAPDSIDSSSTAVPIGNGRYVAMAADRVDGSVQPFLHTMCMMLGLAVEKRDRVLDRSRMKVVEEGDKFRSALLSSVSHDLRTPLASIKAAATSLLELDTSGDPETVKELLLAIDVETDRLDVLVRNLLDMSRLQAGSLNVNIVPISFEDVLPGVLDYLKDDPGRIVIRIASTARGIMADPVLLERVVANLLQNALSYSGPESKVILEAGEYGGEGFIRVVDSGPGISRRQKDEVFKPFQRLGDIPNGTGVGLGLAVVRGFVESMRGMVSLHDTPGGGCTVEIVLPTSEQATSEQVISEQVISEQAGVE